MASGAAVFVITRSPLPYASTLCDLLRLDVNGIIASQPPRTIDEKLDHILTGLHIEAEQLLYVGDREQDRRAALRIGCDFVYPNWIEGRASDTGQFVGVGRPTHLLNRVVRPAAPSSSLLRALQRSARTGASLAEKDLDALESADLDQSTISAIAWTLLRSAPAQEFRADLRRLAFEGVPESAYDCVVPLRVDYSTAFISRTVLRRNEYERDAEARDDLIGLLRELHPMRSVRPSALVDTSIEGKVRSFRPFHQARGGRLLVQAKNWQGSGKGHSGPEAQSGLLELPALVIGSWLAGRSAEVVPAPSTEFSPDRPGQASLRIAYQAAEFAQIPILDVLRKDDGGVECTMRGRGERVFLVDDQVTTGQTLAASAEALEGAGFDVRGAFTWSASNRLFPASLPIQSCWLAMPEWLLGVSGSCKDHLTDPEPWWEEAADELRSILLQYR